MSTPSTTKSRSTAHPDAAVKIPNFVRDEGGKYRTTRPLTEAQIIKAAKALLNKSFNPGQALTSSGLTRCRWLQKTAYTWL